MIHSRVSPLLVTTLAILLAGPSWAHAQPTAALTGTVKDAASSRPLSGAIVTAVKAGAGPRESATDAAGQFRIDGLAPGTYTLRVNGPTDREMGDPIYRDIEQTGIVLSAGTTRRATVVLASDEAPMHAGSAEVGGLDVGSAATGLHLNHDFKDRIPYNPPAGRGSATRSFEALSTVVPGLLPDAYGFSIAGTTSPENRFEIDGLAVNDSRYGILNTPLTFELLDQVSILGGGLPAEHDGTMGGFYHASIPSGGNELHGSVFSSVAPGAFEGPHKRVERQRQTLSTDIRLSSIRDFGMSLSGPIVRDRLFFFAGFAAALREYRLHSRVQRLVYAVDATGNLELDSNGRPIPLLDAAGLQVLDPLLGTRRIHLATEETLQLAGKLTWRIAPGHDLSLSAFATPSHSGGPRRFAFNPESGAIEVDAVEGTQEALAHEVRTGSYGVSLQSSSALRGGRLLVQELLGFHHANRSSLPSDGSSIGSSDGLAGTPHVRFSGFPPARSDGALLDARPNHPLCAALDDASGTIQVDPCPAPPSYSKGGPGILEVSSFDRFQGEAALAYRFELFGTHVLKAGLAIEYTSQDREQAYSGGQIFTAAPSGEFTERQYGVIVGTAPDDVVTSGSWLTHSASLAAGGFLEDAFTLFDRLTLRAGVRYDSQFFWGTDGQLALTLPNQLSPRVATIFDFTNRGRSRIFASYSRYHERLPLALIDHAFPGDRQIHALRSTSSCPDPSMLRVGCDEMTELISGDGDPNPFWTAVGRQRTKVDAHLSAPFSDEFTAGGEYEIFPDANAGLRYVHRSLNRAIENMSQDDGLTFFVANPGFGLGNKFPEAKRDYDALTIFFWKSFSSRWLAAASYTWSHLRGNYSGLFRPETGQLNPNTTSDFDLHSAMANRDGPLPGDRTHAITLYGAKAITLPDAFELHIGLGYHGRSGGPLDLLGPHPLYGDGQVFILPRGAGGRLPWVHSFDAGLSFGYQIGKTARLTVGVEAFNLFNFQAETMREQTFTTTPVRPIPNGTPEDLPTMTTAPCEEEFGPCPYRLVYADTGLPFHPKDLNPSYGVTTAYQPPLSARLTMRLAF